MRFAVWDFNGIVVDDVEAHRAAVNAVFSLFGKPSLPDADAVRRHTTIPFIHGFEAAGITRAAFMAREQEIDHVYHHAYMGSEHAYRLRPGVRETLAWIRKSGGHNVILTNTRRDVLDVQLSRLDIHDCFSWISTADDRKNLGLKMNKADRLKARFAQCGAMEGSVIIGDSTEEPSVAREAGLVSIASTGGWFDRSRLEAARPDHLIDCISEIPGILSTAWKSTPA